MPVRWDGKPTDLFSRKTLEGPTRRALRGITADVAEEITETARRNTPRRTGRTAESWHTTDVELTVGGPAAEAAYEASAENDHFIARFVEAGVSPHSLRPRKFRDSGEGDGPQHPGHRGTHPLGRALDEGDARVGEIAAPRLATWRADILENFKRAKGN